MCVLTLFAAKTTFACNNLFDKAVNYIKTAKNYLLTFTRCSFLYNLVAFSPFCWLYMIPQNINKCKHSYSFDSVSKVGR